MCDFFPFRSCHLSYLITLLRFSLFLFFSSMLLCTLSCSQVYKIFLIINYYSLVFLFLLIYIDFLIQRYKIVTITLNAFIVCSFLFLYFIQLFFHSFCFMIFSYPFISYLFIIFICFKNISSIIFFHFFFHYFIIVFLSFSFSLLFHSFFEFYYDFS